MLTDAVQPPHHDWDRIDAAMVAAVHEPVALFFVDLDGFSR